MYYRQMADICSLEGQRPSGAKALIMISYFYELNHLLFLIDSHYITLVFNKIFLSNIAILDIST